MNNDRVTGTVKETVGKAQAAVGDAIGDHQTEAEGRIRQAAGSAQDVYGQAKDQAGEAFSNASDSAEEMLHSAREAVRPLQETLEREVSARPLIALLIAALIGYVVAQLTSN